MKFSELKAGKKYTIIEQKILDGVGYEIRSGGLWSLHTDDWTRYSMHELMELNFEEIKEYVTFQEAVEWMEQDNNSATFNKNRYWLTSCGNLSKAPCGEYVTFNASMLEPKWELIK